MLFPEASVGAYPRGLSFDATAGNRTEEGRNEFRAYWEAAVEGRCFVLSCNQLARLSDYPERAAATPEDASRVLSRGGSCIISPLGEFLAGPNFEGECILSADLDLGEIARGKFDFDAVGHYARPDIFQLAVDETPKPPVVFRKDEA